MVCCIFSDVDNPDGASLKVIDFGRSIDMKLFPAGRTFTTNCYTDDFQCIEMKEGRPWTTQVLWQFDPVPRTLRVLCSDVNLLLYN